MTFVEPDRTLISGYAVQNKTTPMIFGDGGPPSTWLAVLDKVVGIIVSHVLPDYSPPRAGSLVAQRHVSRSCVLTSHAGAESL